MKLKTNNALIILSCAFIFLSCDKNETTVSKTFSDEYLLENVLFTPANLKTRSSINVDNAEQPIEEAGLVVARLGRKSQKCRGFGVCEWFPKNANTSHLEVNDLEADIQEATEQPGNLLINIRIAELKDPNIDLSQINMEINKDMILNVKDKQFIPISNEAKYNPSVGENGAYQITIRPLK